MKNKRRLIQKLRKVRYDLIVDMRNSLFPFLLGARYRTSPIQGIHKANRHKKDEHLSKLNSIGLEIKNASFCVHVPSEDNDFADGILRKHGIKNPIVIIAPGAKSEIKRWSEKNFTLLASRLAHEAGAFVILVGDKADSPIAKNIASGAKKGVVNLAGETTLGALAALLKKSDLLITNDSAPMHLGVAVGAKVLALFGPTDPRLYGPRGRNDRVIRKKLHCAPCAKAQCEFEHECMKSISAEEVFEAAKEMIGKNGSKTHIAHTN